MAKIIAIVVIGIVAFVGAGIFFEATKAPELPEATLITPPPGVERLPSEFTPEFVLAVGTGAAPAPTANTAASAPAMGIGIGIGAGAAPASGPIDVMGRWIPARGYRGEIKGVKRVGDITRVSIEIAGITHVAPIWIIGNIPGDPGELKPGMSATLDGRIQAIIPSDDPMLRGDIIELADASVLRSYGG
ncbi:MAG: hypothetical protein AAGG07_05135 [Planctomycetota bacterium]